MESGDNEKYFFTSAWMFFGTIVSISRSLTSRKPYPLFKKEILLTTCMAADLKMSN